MVPQSRVWMLPPHCVWSDVEVAQVVVHDGSVVHTQSFPTHAVPVRPRS